MGRNADLFRRLADFEVSVEAAVTANAVCELVLAAVGALGDRRGLQLPVSPALVATSRRGFSLGYCHVNSLARSLSHLSHRGASLADLCRFVRFQGPATGGIFQPPVDFRLPGVVPSAGEPFFTP